MCRIYSPLKYKCTSLYVVGKVARAGRYLFSFSLSRSLYPSLSILHFFNSLRFIDMTKPNVCITKGYTHMNTIFTVIHFDCITKNKQPSQHACMHPRPTTLPPTTSPQVASGGECVQRQGTRWGPKLHTGTLRTPPSSGAGCSLSSLPSTAGPSLPRPVRPVIGALYPQ